MTQGIRKIRLCTLTIAIVVLTSTIFINKSLVYNIKYSILIGSLEELAMQYFSTKNSNSNSKQIACVIPYLNPFSSDIMHFMKSRSMKCTIKQYGRITKDGQYVLQPSKYDNVTGVKVYYIYRHNPNNKHINKDFGVNFSDPIFLKRNDKGIFELKLDEDYIRVKMLINGSDHVEFHAHVSKRSEEFFRKTAKRRKDVKGLGLDIVFLMIDSQSNGNFHRHLKKSMHHLLNDENTIILKGHTIIGDGTTAQLSGILIGEIEENLPETRRGYTKNGTCDQFNFIFKDLHRAGYVTMFSEDNPGYSSFNYRLNGFNETPTSWYLRPYWLAQTGSLKCDVEYGNKFLKTFIETYEDLPKMSLTMHAAIAHNDFNNLQVIDDDLVEMIDFFKSPIRINQTIFIIFGDHGARIGDFRHTTQGKLEERLPFFSLTLPPNFKSKHSDLFAALKKNANVLTNHFDVYATLQHMLSYPDLPNKTFIGQSLFTEIDPANRTCENSGVKEHWCPCLVYKIVSVSDVKVRNVTKEVVNHINRLINENKKIKGLCANLSVGTIMKASLKIPKDAVTQFKKTEKNKNCDSCKVVLDTTAVSKQYYEVVFTVNPSGGIFEANVDILSNNATMVDPNISRINLYGNQPRCIMNEFPHLRPYCFCL